MSSKLKIDTHIFTQCGANSSIGIDVFLYADFPGIYSPKNVSNFA